MQRGYTWSAAGSVLIQAGKTTVLCTASVEESVPPWLEGKNRGWVTAEYSMLPGSTRPRKARERAGKLDGRSSEIQRLIGRSLRATVDLAALGPRTITVDCDVLDADGGTRTACITGGWVALVDAVQSLADAPDPKKLWKQSVAAISVGLLHGQAWLDLDYAEDSAADVDLNVVLTGDGRFVELQGTGERTTFCSEELARLLDLAQVGIKELRGLQQAALGPVWPIF